jgi:hypothetical protein
VKAASDPMQSRQCTILRSSMVVSDRIEVVVAVDRADQRLNDDVKERGRAPRTQRISELVMSCSVMPIKRRNVGGFATT